MPEEICAARRCQRAPVLGLLCGEHGQRLADHLGAREGHAAGRTPSHGLPWMWDHLALAYPSLSGWSGGTLSRDGVDDAEAERLAAVLVLRQDIHDHLSAVSSDLAERLGRHGPEAAPSQRLAVLRTARWLLAHIEHLRAGQGIREDLAAEGVASVLEEADDLASRAHALAPWRPAPTRIDGIPCRCGAVGTVHDHGDVRKCWRCGRTYTELEWAALMRVLAYRFREEGQTA